MRKFAKELGEDFTLLARIESGQRYPPKQRLKKFAQLLSLSPRQLEALVAVERRGLNPHVLLPEIPPPDVSHDWIEDEALRILNKYRRAVDQPEVKTPVPIEEVIACGCGLSTEHRDFQTQKEISSRSAGLYGGLYPDGHHRKDRLVLVNSGRVHGRKLSPAEKRTTVAHEAGHYVLHWTNKESAQLFLPFTTGPTFCREAECDQTPFNSLEYQATAFGACLLMPRAQFIREWQKTSGAEARMAEAFCVPQSLVRLRSKMLGLSSKM